MKYATGGKWTNARFMLLVRAYYPGVSFRVEMSEESVTSYDFDGMPIPKCGKIICELGEYSTLTFVNYTNSPGPWVVYQCGSSEQSIKSEEELHNLLKKLTKKEVIK